jgi:hypothetical protein
LIRASENRNVQQSLVLRGRRFYLIALWNEDRIARNLLRHAKGWELGESASVVKQFLLATKTNEIADHLEDGGECRPTDIALVDTFLEPMSLRGNDHAAADSSVVGAGPDSFGGWVCDGDHPPNAHVVIRDQEGKEVTSAQTPAQVKLDRSVSMAVRAHYTATIESPGYQTQLVDMPYKLNPWTIGNVLIGGIPGLLADGATGAMWMPSHDKIDVNLQPLGSNPNPLATSAPSATHSQVAIPPAQQGVDKPGAKLATYSAPLQQK